MRCSLGELLLFALFWLVFSQFQGRIDFGTAVGRALRDSVAERDEPALWMLTRRVYRHSRSSQFPHDFLWQNSQIVDGRPAWALFKRCPTARIA